MSTLPENLPDRIRKHLEQYLRDPEAAHMWDASVVGWKGLIPTLLLETTGRKSGEQRIIPLIYGKSDGSFIVVASKGGAPSHPAWYLNLCENSQCSLQVGTEKLRARARDAENQEHEKLWNLMIDLYPPYQEYQQAAGERRIPIVVLDPVNKDQERI